MEMEEIDLTELFSYFLKRAYIIIIAALVCLVVGLTYTIFLKEPKYKSDVNVIIVNKDTQVSSTLQSEITANQKLAATYRELVESRRILDQVIFIDDGRIVLISDSDELRQKEKDSIDGIFRRMFNC